MNNINDHAIDGAWLLSVLDGSFSEIYFVDCKTKRFIHANDSAQQNLQYTMAQLETMSPLDLAPDLTEASLKKILNPLREGITDRVTFETVHHRKDGSTYPIEFRIFRSPPHTTPVFIAIGNDISQHHAAAVALQLSELRYQAIVSNIPGLVFQFLRRADGHIEFTYVSDRCEDLLDISAAQLKTNPESFLNLIMSDDRASYLESMLLSAQQLLTWNWKGRIWIEAWQDIKWIDIRATPSAMPDGTVVWDGVITNITQTKLEEIEAKRSSERLAELSAHIQQVKEQERMRIAREVHDDLGGNLTAIKMALTLVKRRISNKDTALIEKVNYIDTLADRTIESVHRIAGDLRPSILDFGIVAAIEWQSQEFERQMGIPCQFSSTDEDIELNADQATALFRVFQEALTNISKHAHATRVDVNLKRTKNGITLDIADNGRGMEQSDRLKPHSFGIRGMMERVSSLGGKLSITASPSAGSLITIQIPLN
ncbi:two-component sensor histidine kinase [Sulfuriferula sp. AH1]|uniref:PAS domain-containing sensor histidine kinase n=1 Tax=Sulfuriferula sp. AH1 TaxID=1985873 RepID=UPI000B3B355E|nr:sensor histidine kinase [Sulfuriferula sp. AH1]ARU31510.1 two-component sensor histidine kinase [Sulfuriferula sp. AH1]